MILNTSELRTGDIVITHGMRVLLENEPRIYGHSDDCYVYAFDGRVINMDEVKAEGHVPMSYLRFQRWDNARGWVTDREDVWIVQGNAFARWTVER